MPCPTGSKRFQSKDPYGGNTNFCIYPPPGANFCPKGSQVALNDVPQGGAWTEASMVATWTGKPCDAGNYQGFESITWSPYAAAKVQFCRPCPKGSTSSAGQTVCKCPAGSFFTASYNDSLGATTAVCKALTTGVQGTGNLKREKPTKKTGGTMAPELDLPGASSGAESGRPGLTTGGRKP